MAKDFSFPFYINNWIGGVMYYTFEQKGAYLELLLLQFNHGKFTETQVKQVLNTSYSNVWETIKEKFETDGKFFWNEKMEQVKEERKSFVESRRNNRLGKTKPLTSEKEVIKTSSTSDKLVEGESKDKGICINKNKVELIFPFDSENFKNVWNQLRASKKWKKKENSALQASLIKLSKYPEHEALEMMLDAIAGEYQGLFPIKKNNQNGTKSEQYLESISSGTKAVNDLADEIERRERNKEAESAN